MTAAMWTLVIVGLVWTFIWKAFGLWYSANKKDKIWFIVFLLINLLGIPPIIYLYMKTDFFKKLDKKIKKSMKK